MARVRITQFVRHEATIITHSSERVLDSPRCRAKVARMDAPDALAAYRQTRAVMQWRRPPPPVRWHLQRLCRVRPGSTHAAWPTWWRAVERLRRPNAERHARLREALSQAYRFASPWSSTASQQPLSAELLTSVQMTRLRDGLRPPASSAFATLISGQAAQRYGPYWPQEWSEAVREANDPAVHPLVRACRLYCDICFYHPFDDGNGRAARVWLSAVCWRARIGIPSLIQLSQFPHDPARPARCWGFVSTAARSLCATHRYGADDSGCGQAPA